jgi:hypothetical protein
MMEAAVNKLIGEDKRSMLAVYHLSIHLFTKEEIFTSIQKK